MMKLHWSPRSPFVRKVMIVLHETGLIEHVECMRTVAAVAEPNARLMQDNPLSQIPVLICDDGMVLYDSPVICEYLDSRQDGAKLFPAGGDARWQTLRRQALGDGMLAVLLVWRQERNKPHIQQMDSWLASFDSKLHASLAVMQNDVRAESAAFKNDGANVPFDIGHIATGCMLSYLDFRFADIDWRSPYPRLAAWHAQFCLRPSVLATEVVNDDTADALNPGLQ